MGGGRVVNNGMFERDLKNATFAVLHPTSHISKVERIRDGVHRVGEVTTELASMMDLEKITVQTDIVAFLEKLAVENV